MDNRDTAEYRAFQGCFSKLVTGVQADVESVATKALEKNLITPKQVRNAINEHHDEMHRTINLLMKILARIQQNPACFDRFVTIVKNTPIMEELAQQLTSEYEQQMQKSVSDRSPSHSLPTEALGGLHDLQKSDVIASKTDLEQKFTTLVSKCANSREITPRALANIILCLNLFDSESDMDESLVADCKSNLQQASSNDSIIEIIKPYMSFLNPELLGHIIEILGTDQDRKNFKRYMKALEKFCKITKATLPHNQPDKLFEPEMVFQQVHIVMETAIGTLESVQILQSNIAKALKLNVAAFQVKTDDDRPPLVCSFQLPKVAIECEQVFPLSNEQERELKALGLTSLKCGKYSFENPGTQSDKISEEEIEIACLGRPFHLGMLYDCRNDRLLSTKLCSDNIKLEESCQVNDYRCKVLEDDSLETKALSLQLSPALKLSLMSNLIQDASKSTKYWNDRCRSKRQVRVSLKFTSTTVKKYFPTNNLTEHLQPKNIECATHVVTGVLYGFNAYCVFDRTLRENERFEDVHEEMLTTVELVKFKVLSSSDSTHIESHNYSCTVYSDIGDSTLREVVDQFHKFKDLSSKDKLTPVPIKVWLYPLEKLDPDYKVFTREVGTNLADKVQSKFEFLHNVQMLANDLLTQYNVTLSRFQHTKGKITKFIEIIKTYSNKLQKNIAQLLPQIRGGSAEEIKLAKVIEENFTSPLKYDSLITWLKQVKEEISTLEMLVNQIKHIDFVSSEELQSIITDPDCDYNVCLMFQVALEDDQTISYFESYLQSKQVNQCLPVSETEWYTNTELMKTITDNIEHFKTFMESNSENKRTKFVAVMCSTPTATQKEPISIYILLYEGTSCKPWEPPGPPGKPTVKGVTHDTVKLEWSQPEYGSQSVECYKVSYNPVDQPQDNNTLTTTSAQPAATISGLAASTKYVFTVQSKCKVGLGAKGKTSDPVETLGLLAPASPKIILVKPVQEPDFRKKQKVAPKKPKVTFISQTSITLEWALPEESSESIDSYTISYRKFDDLTTKWTKNSTNSSEKTKDVCNLSPQTKYIFRVRLELEDDEVGPWSEVSDPIETKAPICQPGKPRATIISHNSITLEWDKPKHNSHNVQSYLVCYTSHAELKHDWKEFEVVTKSNDTKFSIPNLSPQTKYVFKVRPELDGITGTWSEESDLIETNKLENASFAGLGKPKANDSEVSDNSITLQWKKPEFDCESIECYTVSYRSVNDKLWKRETTDGAQEKLTLTGLKSDTNYLFKVRSECGGDVGPISEQSDPIKTRATSPPEELTFLNDHVTHNSIMLKWNKPKHGYERIKQYKILVYSSADGQLKMVKELLTDSKQENKLIEDLSVNTTYAFQVQPICFVNHGCTSEMSHTIRTKPTSSPGKLTVTDVTHESVTLRWNKPDCGSNNVIHYTIFIECVDSLTSMNVTKITTKGVQEMFTIHELGMQKKYRFKVQPECGEVGVGMESDMSDVIETMATSPPGKPTVGEVTHESVSLEWTEPEKQIATIEGYEVWYRKTDSTEEDWRKIVPNEPRCRRKITGQYIDYDSEYEFKVVPICSSGKGTESKISEPVRTKTTSPPGQPVACSETHNSVKLKWMKPEVGGKNIKYYKLVYSRFDTKSETNSEFKSLTAIEEEKLIGGLSPYTKYKFKVQPQCHTGPGAESEWSEPIRTKHVFYKPGQPKVTKQTTYDEIYLKWARPEHGWEEVDSFSIHYCEEGISNPTWRELPNTISSTSMQQSVTGLLPGISYIFKVKSHVQAKPRNQLCTEEESEPSDPIHTKTTTPPGKPEAVEKSYKHIKLKWSCPDKGSVYIDHYIIEYQKKSQMSHKLKQRTTAGGIMTTTTITGLESKTPYIITVIPQCPDGEGEPSESITVETLPSCKPGPVVRVASTYDSITLKWKKPDYQAGMVQRYMLSYKSQRDPRGHYQDHEVTAKTHESVLLGGLTHNTEYTFTVVPIILLCHGPNAIGTESSTSEPIATMATSPPGKPIKSRKPATHEDVTLQWTKPQIGYENIKYYEVTYKKSTRLSSQITKGLKTDTNQQETTVRDLIFDTKYVFKVRAVCSTDTEGKYNYGMESDFSDPIETNKTSPPGRPTAIAFTHNTVTLQWRKPKYGSTDIERYTIYFSKDGKQWNIVQKSTEQQKPTSSRPITCTVHELEPRTSYFFKVLPVCKSGTGSYSEISNPVTTNATGPPSKPTPSKVMHDSIHVHWEPPEYGYNIIDHYQLSYTKLQEGTMTVWEIVKVKGGKNEYYECVQPLEMNTEYKFKVVPCIGKDSDSEMDKSTESKCSDIIKTKATSSPGKPEVIKVNHNSVHLKWTKPTYGIPTKYEILCYYADPKLDQDPIRKTTILAIENGVVIENLKPQTSYKFQIRPVISGNCYGTDSEISDVLTTDLVCRPSQLRASEVTSESIKLKWTNPEHGYEYIEYYVIHYNHYDKLTDSQVKQTKQTGCNNIVILDLRESTKYTFSVCAKLKDNDKVTALFSEELAVDTIEPPLAVRLCRNAQQLPQGLSPGPLIYKVPEIIYTMRDKEKMIHKCYFGDPELGRGKRERVLMLVGATGEGKSTLIECIVNYILGTKWEYDLRFQLIQEEEARSQAESQTRFITAYTFYPVEGSTLTYILTIVDTPGYGDSRGIKHDVALTEQIKQFFSTPPPQGIDHIDGVGFVVRAGSARLTPTQEYIFDSILGVFGKDMKDNIFLMITFCDAKKPQVLEAIRVANIPNVDYFKFNNSALYADNSDTDDIISSIYWKMGSDTLKNFFTNFEQMQPRSLVLTNDVLEEREQLETLVEGLQKQITHSLDLIRELKQDKKAITDHRLSADSNKPFTYEVEVMRGFEKELPPKSKYFIVRLVTASQVTLCLNCHFTCHDSCTIKNDEKRYKCAAMKGKYHQRNKDSCCGVCPGKCHWSKHVNRPYRYEQRPVKVKKTLEDLVKKYSTPISPDSRQQSTSQAILSGIAKQLIETYDKVLELIKQTQESIDKLDQIALKKSDPSRDSSSQVAYIELLIEAERKGRKTGCEERIEALKVLKDRAQYAVEVAKTRRQASNEN